MITFHRWKEQNMSVFYLWDFTLSTCSFQYAVTTSNNCSISHLSDRASLTTPIQSACTSKYQADSTFPWVFFHKPITLGSRTCKRRHLVHTCSLCTRIYVQRVTNISLLSLNSSWKTYLPIFPSQLHLLGAGWEAGNRDGASPSINLHKRSSTEI